MIDKSPIVFFSVLINGSLRIYHSPIESASKSTELSRCEDPSSNLQFPYYPPGYCPGPANEPIRCPGSEPEIGPLPCRDDINGIGRCSPDPCNDPIGLSCLQPDPIEANISNMKLVISKSELS